MNEAFGCSRSCCISVNCRRKKRHELFFIGTANGTRNVSSIRIADPFLRPDSASESVRKRKRESEWQQIRRERKEISEGRERERSRDTISNCSGSAAKLDRWNNLRIANRVQRPQLRLRTHKYFQVIVIPIVCVRFWFKHFNTNYVKLRSRYFFCEEILFQVSLKHNRSLKFWIC